MLACRATERSKDSEPPKNHHHRILPSKTSKFKNRDLRGCDSTTRLRRVRVLFEATHTQFQYTTAATTKAFSAFFGSQANATQHIARHSSSSSIGRQQQPSQIVVVASCLRRRRHWAAAAALDVAGMASLCTRPLSSHCFLMSVIALCRQSRFLKERQLQNGFS